MKYVATFYFRDTQKALQSMKLDIEAKSLSEAKRLARLTLGNHPDAARLVCVEKAK